MKFRAFGFWGLRDVWVPFDGFYKFFLTPFSACLAPTETRVSTLPFQLDSEGF